MVPGRRVAVHARVRMATYRSGRSVRRADPEVGDKLGSRILAARLARDLIRLCFLIERRYAPYSKWLGSAFGQLDAAAEVQPSLERALAAAAYEEREAGLVDAYEVVARRFNALDVVTDIQEPTARSFYGRPFLVVMADRFATASFRAIEDVWLRVRCHPWVASTSSSTRPTRSIPNAPG